MAMKRFLAITLSSSLILTAPGSTAWADVSKRDLTEIYGNGVTVVPNQPNTAINTYQPLSTGPGNVETAIALLKLAAQFAELGQTKGLSAVEQVNKMKLLAAQGSHDVTGVVRGRMVNPFAGYSNLDPKSASALAIQNARDLLQGSGVSVERLMQELAQQQGQGRISYDLSKLLDSTIDEKSFELLREGRGKPGDKDYIPSLRDTTQGVIDEALRLYADYEGKRLFFADREKELRDKINSLVEKRNDLLRQVRSKKTEAESIMRSETDENRLQYANDLLRTVQRLEKEIAGLNEQLGERNTKTEKTGLYAQYDAYEKLLSESTSYSSLLKKWIEDKQRNSAFSEFNFETVSFKQGDPRIRVDDKIQQIRKDLGTSKTNPLEWLKSNGLTVGTYVASIASPIFAPLIGAAYMLDAYRNKFMEAESTLSRDQQLLKENDKLKQYLMNDQFGKDAMAKASDNIQKYIKDVYTLGGDKDVLMKKILAADKAALLGQKKFKEFQERLGGLSKDSDWRRKLVQIVSDLGDKKFAAQVAKMAPHLSLDQAVKLLSSQAPNVIYNGAASAARSMQVEYQRQSNAYKALQREEFLSRVRYGQQVQDLADRAKSDPLALAALRLTNAKAFNADGELLGGRDVFNNTFGNTKQNTPVTAVSFGDRYKQLQDTYGYVFNSIQRPMTGAVQAWNEGSNPLDSLFKAGGRLFEEGTGLIFNTAMQPIHMGLGAISFGTGQLQNLLVGDGVGTAYIVGGLNSIDNTMIAQMLGAGHSNLGLRYMVGGANAYSDFATQYDGAGNRLGFNTGNRDLDIFMNWNAQQEERAGNSFSSYRDLFSRSDFAHVLSLQAGDGWSQFKNANLLTLDGVANAIGGLGTLAQATAGFALKTTAEVAFLYGPMAEGIQSLNLTGRLGRLTQGALEQAFVKIPGYQFAYSAAHDISNAFSGNDVLAGRAIGNFGGLVLGMSAVSARGRNAAQGQGLWSFSKDFATSLIPETFKMTTQGVATLVAGPLGAVGTGYGFERLASGFAARSQTHITDLTIKGITRQEILNTLPKPGFMEMVAGAHRFNETQVNTIYENTNRLMGALEIARMDANADLSKAGSMRVTRSAAEDFLSYAKNRMSIDGADVFLSGQKLDAEVASSPLVRRALMNDLLIEKNNNDVMEGRRSIYDQTTNPALRVRESQEFLSLARLSSNDGVINAAARDLSRIEADVRDQNILSLGAQSILKGREIETAIQNNDFKTASERQMERNNLDLKRLELELVRIENGASSEIPALSRQHRLLKIESEINQLTQKSVMTKAEEVNLKVLRAEQEHLIRSGEEGPLTAKTQESLDVARTEQRVFNKYEEAAESRRVSEQRLQDSNKDNNVSQLTPEREQSVRKQVAEKLEGESFKIDSKASEVTTALLEEIARGGASSGADLATRVVENIKARLATPAEMDRLSQQRLSNAEADRQAFDVRISGQNASPELQYQNYRSMSRYRDALEARKLVLEKQAPPESQAELKTVAERLSDANSWLTKNESANADQNRPNSLGKTPTRDGRSKYLNTVLSESAVRETISRMQPGVEVSDTQIRSARQRLTESVLRDGMRPNTSEITALRDQVARDAVDLVISEKMNLLPRFSEFRTEQDLRDYTGSAQRRSELNRVLSVEASFQSQIASVEARLLQKPGPGPQRALEQSLVSLKNRLEAVQESRRALESQIREARLARTVAEIKDANARDFANARWTEKIQAGVSRLWNDFRAESRAQIGLRALENNGHWSPRMDHPVTIQVEKFSASQAKDIVRDAITSNVKSLELQLKEQGASADTIQKLTDSYRKEVEKRAQADAISEILRGRSVGIQMSVGGGKTTVVYTALVGRLLSSGRMNADVVVKNGVELKKYLESADMQLTGADGKDYMIKLPAMFDHLIPGKSSKDLFVNMADIAERIQHGQSDKERAQALQEFEKAMSNPNAVRFWTSESMGHLNTHSVSKDANRRIMEALDRAGMDETRIVLADEGDLMLADPTKYVLSNNSTPIGNKGIPLNKKVDAVFDLLGYQIAPDGKGEFKSDAMIKRAADYKEYMDLIKNEKPAYYQDADGQIYMTNKARELFDKHGVAQTKSGEAERILQGIEGRSGYTIKEKEAGSEQRVLAPLSSTLGIAQADRVLQDPLLATAIVRAHGSTASEALKQVMDSATSQSSSGGRLFVGRSQVVLLSGSLEAVGAAADAFGIPVKSFGAAKNVFSNLEAIHTVQSGHEIAERMASNVVGNLERVMPAIQRDYEAFKAQNPSDPKTFREFMREHKEFKRQLTIVQNGQIREWVQEIIQNQLADSAVLSSLGLEVATFDHTSPSRLANGREYSDYAAREPDILIASLSLGGRGVDYKKNIDLHVDVTGQSISDMVRMEDLRQALGRVDRFDGQEFTRTIYGMENVLRASADSVIHARSEFLLAGSARLRGEGEPVVHFEVDGKASGYELLKRTEDVSTLSPAEQLRLAAWGQEMRASSRGMQSNQVDLIRDVHLETPLMRLLKNTANPESATAKALEGTISRLLNHEFYSPNARELPSGYQSGRERMRQSLESLKVEAVRALTELERTLPSGTEKDIVRRMRNEWQKVDLKQDGVAKSIAEKNISLQQAFERAIYRGDELAPTRKGIATSVQMIAVERQAQTIRQALEAGQTVSENRLIRLQEAVSRAVARHAELSAHPLWSQVAGAPTSAAVAQILGGTPEQIQSTSIGDRVSGVQDTFKTLYTNISQTHDLIPQAPSFRGRVERGWNALAGGVATTFGSRLNETQQIGAVLNGLPMQAVMSDSPLTVLQGWTLRNPQALVGQLTTGRVADLASQYQQQLILLGTDKSEARAKADGLKNDLTSIAQTAVDMPADTVVHGYGFQTARTERAGQPAVVLDISKITARNGQGISAPAVIEAAKLIRASEKSGVEVYIQLPNVDSDRAHGLLQMVRDANQKSDKANIYIAQSGESALKVGAKANHDSLIDMGQVRRAIPSTGLQLPARLKAVKANRVDAKGPILDLDAAVGQLRTLQKAETESSPLADYYRSQFDNHLETLLLSADALNRVNTYGLLALPETNRDAFTRLFASLSTAKNDPAAGRAALETFLAETQQDPVTGDQSVNTHLPEYLARTQSAYATPQQAAGAGMQLLPAFMAAASSEWMIGISLAMSSFGALFTERRPGQSFGTYMKNVGVKAGMSLADITEARGLSFAVRLPTIALLSVGFAYFAVPGTVTAVAMFGFWLKAKAFVQMADFAIGAWKHARVSQSFAEGALTPVPSAISLPQEPLEPAVDNLIPIDRKSSSWRVPRAATLIIGFFTAAAAVSLGADKLSADGHLDSSFFQAVTQWMMAKLTYLPIAAPFVLGATLLPDPSDDKNDSQRAHTVREILSAA